MNPIKCPDCGSTCLEIKTHGYPKLIMDREDWKTLKKGTYEHRFVCPKCGSEWLYDGLRKWIEKIPIDAQFHFNKSGNEVRLDVTARMTSEKEYRKALFNCETT